MFKLWFVFCVLLGWMAIVSQSSDSIAPMIIGGNDNAKARFVVQIFAINQHNTYKFKCSGSFVSTKRVLTAAHCFNEPKNFNYFVVYDGKSFPKYGIPVLIKSVVFHPSLDIAIVRLQERVSQNRVIQLEHNWKCKKNKKVWIYGYGDVDNRGTRPSDLKMLTTKVNECCANSKKAWFSTATEGQTACFGDSGAPAVDKYDHQIGVMIKMEPARQNGKRICAIGKKNYIIKISSIASFIRKNL